MEKARSTIISETLAGAATIAITILTIAFFYRLVALKASLASVRYERSHLGFRVEATASHINQV
jgi:hypothetical protein